MKKNVVKTLALLMTVILLVGMSMAGCTTKQEAVKGNSTTAEVSTQTQSPAGPEKVILKVYGPSTGLSLRDGIQDDLVSKEIERVTGVSIDLDAHPEETKLNAMLASGDFPDLLLLTQTTSQQSSAIVKTMIEGNMLLPMDDLIKSDGPNISKLDKMLAFCRKYYSNSTNKQYVLQGGIDPSPTKGFDSGIGPLLRWDYYAELGYPQIKNGDDWLKVVADMLAKHPKNDEGQPRYGFSLFFEWGWAASFYHTGDIIKSLEGQSVVSDRGGMMEYDMMTETVRPEILSEDSALWTSVEFSYKANKMGLLDPESFTNKWDTIIQKAGADRVLSSMWSWAYADINKKLEPQGKGYEIIPMNSKGFVEGTASPLGFNNRLWTIPKTCSNPKAAIRLLDYIYSVEGARTISSGVLGIHYIVKDGKMVIPQAISEKQKTDSNWNINTGIGKYGNFAGLSPNNIDPKYNQKVGLWGDPTNFEISPKMNAFEEAYTKHYGIANMADKYAYLEKSTFEATIAAVMAVPPEEIKAIDQKIGAYLGVELPKLLISKSDKEFMAGKKRIIEECKKKGMEQSVEWWTNTWSQAIKEAKQYR